MGIRSDVYITVPMNMCDEFEKVVLDTEMDSAFIEEFSSKKVRVYFAKDIKWYESYNEVETIEYWVYERTEKGVSLLQIIENEEITGIGNNYELYTRIEVVFNG